MIRAITLTFGLTPAGWYILKERLFAFWNYDLFPYVLGGEVTKISSCSFHHAENYPVLDAAHCRVETKEFGKNQGFCAIKIMPYESGKKLRCALKTLEREYKKENDKLFLEFTKKLDELLAPHEISRKYGHR